LYITINSIKKTLGKYIELNDLYIGIPMIMIFLSLFAFSTHKLFSIIFLTICVFLMIPINLSKKNRMYKVLGLFFKYIFKCKNYIYTKER
jgi:Na+/alanine symporter